MTWFHCWFSTDSTSGAPNPQAVWGAGQSMQAQINLCKQQISGHLPVCTSLSLVQAEVRMCVPADHSCKGCTRTAHFLCSPVPLFPPPPQAAKPQRLWIAGLLVRNQLWNVQTVIMWWLWDATMVACVKMFPAQKFERSPNRTVVKRGLPVFFLS